MATYKGFDVLQVAPNVAQDPKDTMDRTVDLFDRSIGKVTVYNHGPVANADHTFDWFMPTRADVDVFRAFVAARAGMAVPAWVPSWRADLMLTAAMGATDVSFTIQAIDFSKFSFPYLARCYVAFIVSGGATQIYRKVTGAVDNGNGTETLTIDSALGQAITTDTMISYLFLCRLGSDAVAIQWETNTSAQAQLSLVEVPLEVPA